MFQSTEKNLNSEALMTTQSKKWLTKCGKKCKHNLKRETTQNLIFSFIE